MKVSSPSDSILIAIPSLACYCANKDSQPATVHVDDNYLNGVKADKSLYGQVTPIIIIIILTIQIFSLFRILNFNSICANSFAQYFACQDVKKYMNRKFGIRYR